MPPAHIRANVSAARGSMVVSLRSSVVAAFVGVDFAMVVVVDVAAVVGMAFSMVGVAAFVFVAFAMVGIVDVAVVLGVAFAMVVGVLGASAQDLAPPPAGRARR